MRQIITFIILILFLSCEKKSINTKHKKDIENIDTISSQVKTSSSQNDTIIQKILYNEDVLNHISFAYKYGHNHIVINSKIIFNKKNIEIDTMNFSLSKEYKTDKDIVIEIDSVDPAFYRFIVYHKNGNSYYNGFVKKNIFWETMVESYEEVDNIDKNSSQVDRLIYQNDTIIQRILYNKDILNYISSIYKNGYNHIVINSKITFSKKNIQIDNMNFSLSKKYKTDKNIVIRLDSLYPTSYMFKIYSTNVNTHFYGTAKKDSLWKVKIKLFEDIN